MNVQMVVPHFQQYHPHIFLVSDDKLTIEYVPPSWGDKKFPGEFTDGETPDPFPNSEAKLVRPMVVALR